MNVKIIAVGKIKEKFIREGIREYSKRLSRYCKLEIVEVPDEKTPENLSQKEIEQVKEIEGKRILKKLPKNSYTISLVIEGKSFTSEKLSKKIDDLTLEGINNITFIIGGSLGLSQEVVQQSHLKLSFSKMTFPHQLMRLILLEQIYRTFKISYGEPYHK